MCKKKNNSNWGLFFNCGVNVAFVDVHRWSQVFSCNMLNGPMSQSLLSAWLLVNHCMRKEREQTRACLSLCGSQIIFKVHCKAVSDEENSGRNGEHTRCFVYNSGTCLPVSTWSMYMLRTLDSCLPFSTCFPVFSCWLWCSLLFSFFHKADSISLLICQLTCICWWAKAL